MWFCFGSRRAVLFCRMESEEYVPETDSGNEVSSGDTEESDYPEDETYFETEIRDIRDTLEAEEEFRFDVLSPEEIVQHMIDRIKEVNAVVQIPPTVTRILLNHLKWHSEKLYEWYYDGDRDGLFKEACIINPQKTTSNSNVAKASDDDQVSVEVCEICYRDVPHSRLTCAAPTCEVIVDDQIVMNFIEDANVKLKFQHLITNNFVECNRLLKWCPRPGCNNAIKVHYVYSHPVTCTCGHAFCFSCSQNCHEPVPCDMLKKWLKKCNDDIETSNWIATNTKQCPKCKVTIEKNGGCNHIICRNRACAYHFCWVCLRYTCNQYKRELSKASRDASEKSREARLRYLFYCDRYLNHKNSLKFEHKLYDSVRENMNEMLRHTMSWIEVQFLEKAVDILCQCRQTLMYTYVFAYYLKKNNQSVIFECNQCDLEAATEQLSEYLERDMSEDFLSIKQKVQDKSKYCEGRRKVLMELVREGHENESWEYNCL